MLTASVLSTTIFLLLVLAGANKAKPCSDVINDEQESYVFGNTKMDATHWNLFALNIFEEYTDALDALFNNGRSYDRRSEPYDLIHSLFVA